MENKYRTHELPSFVSTYEVIFKTVHMKTKHVIVIILSCILIYTIVSIVIPILNEIGNEEIDRRARLIREGW